MDGGGIATKPPGTTAVAGQTITSAARNSIDDDLYAILNTFRPAFGGGTVNTPALARVALGLEIGVNVQAYSAAVAVMVAAWTSASASGPASLAFAEDTDNGTNKITLKAPAAIASDKVITFPDATGTPVLLETADQIITGGARVTPDTTIGTITTGTVTPDPGDRSLQSYINNGPHTLAPGSNNGYYLLDIINAASAGAITVSGWTKVVGAFTATNGHKFRCSGSISTAGSLLSIQAMQ